jgi:hypothetical protein
MELVALNNWYFVHNSWLTICVQSTCAWNTNWSMAFNHGNNDVIPEGLKKKKTPTNSFSFF